MFGYDGHGRTRITIEVDIDADAVLDRLEKMKERSKKMKPVFFWAKRELELKYAANFALNGLPSGGWSPLSPKYASWKSARVPAAPLMVRSGRLFRSVTELEDSQVNVIRDNGAEFGTSVEYAKFHQYGTSKMAKRRVIFTPVGFTHDLAGVIAKYIIHGSA